MRFGSARTGGPSGSLTLHRTDNRDDILFRSVSVTGQLGFFQNFALTRHQGFDAEVAGRIGAVDLGAAYSRLDATYQANGTLRVGERNVQVDPGTPVAGLPRQALKLWADWKFSAAWTFGADLQAYGRRVSAGNEDGRTDNDDDKLDLGTAGYTLVNLRASWKPSKGLEVFARINNVFDRRYFTLGALAETLFDASGAYSGVERDALFVAPGASRAVFVGAKIKF